MTATTGTPVKPARVRRRAVRAAGPAISESTEAGTVAVESPAAPPTRRMTPVGPPPRQRSNGLLVGLVALAVWFVAASVLAAGLLVLLAQQRHADAQRAHDQRFVDTATQTVVNMFSYSPDTVDQSVNRFVDGTSGPLRGMLSANNNVDNLKALFRDTQVTSEVAVNGAALEDVDKVSDNASVLVSVRVTVSDGVNKPSQAYRIRVVVHEDDGGRMTAYDLKYPDGGN